MSSDYSQVSALVSLISNAAKTLEAQFIHSSKSAVPSLDDTTSHPLDTAIASPELQTVIATLEGACAQLCATVARPNHTMMNKAMGIYESGCLHVAIKFKIPDLLQESPSGMHVEELGKKTGLDVGKLSRVLRLLATKHVFREVSTNVFANNRLSHELLSTNPLSNVSLWNLDECNKALTTITEALADPVWGHSTATKHALFNKYNGSPLPLWAYYEKEAKERGASFGIGLTGWNTATQSHAVVTQFPWGDLQEGTSVCDVGSGIGFISMQIAKAYPKLQLKLQDTPERINQAKTEIWPKQCPEAIEEQRVEFKPINFLVESPIKDCDVYYMKNITHNWPEKESTQILRNVCDGMALHSRLLLHEYIIQPASRMPENESELVQAPEPLLPNYGAGKIRQFNLDLSMMTMLNAQERTLAEHIKLAKAAGLRFVKVWAVGEMWLLEYSVA